MDLLNDLEFQAYRVKEIEEGVLFLRKVSDYGSDYFKGAMDMLKAVINLPTKLIPPTNESQKVQAEILKARAFDAFEAKMMRRFVQEEGD